MKKTAWMLIPLALSLLTGCTPSSRESSASSEALSASSLSVPSDCLCTFQNYNSALLKTKTVHKGDTVIYDGEAPSRSKDAHYSYSWSGWDKPLTNIQSDTVFTATYAQTVNSYTVTFRNADGTVLDTSTVSYGNYARYTKADPTKPSDTAAWYSFLGWDQDPVITPIQEDTTFTATYITHAHEAGMVYEALDATHYQVKSYAGTATAVAISPEYDGHPVTAIAEKAFFQNTALVSVDFGKAPITAIGDYAFWDDYHLRNAPLPSTLETLGAFAFENDPIAQVKIPATLASYGSGAYARSSGFQAFEIDPANTHFKAIDGILYSAAGDILYACPSAKSFSETFFIPSTVNTLASDAFAGSLVTSVSFEEASLLSTISDDCFADSQLVSVVIPGHITTIEPYAFASTPLKNVTFTGNGLTTIGLSAFSHCESLIALALPRTVTTIGNSAFGYCSALKRLFLSASVTSIGADAFKGCSALTLLAEVPFADQPSGWSSGFNPSSRPIHFDVTTATVQYAFVAATATEAAHYTVSSFNKETSDEGAEILAEYDDGTNGKFPVTTIGESAGVYSHLKAVVIPEGITAIEEKAFFNVNYLCVADLPSSLLTIGDFAFASAPLKELILPSHLVSIGRGAFSYVAQSTITLPASLSTLGCGAFVGQVGSFAVEAGNTAFKAVDGVLFSADGAHLMQYPAGRASVDTYTLPDGVTDLDEDSFEGSRITHFVFPTSLTTVGRNAFEYSYAASVELPDSVTTIGDFALFSCSRLTSFRLPSSFTKVPYGFARGCSKLSAIDLPATVTELDSQAFYEAGLTTLDFSPFTTLGELALSASALTSVELPSTVTSIGGEAFELCAHLASVSFGAAVSALSTRLFHSDAALSAFTIQASAVATLTSIGSFALSGCPLLTALTYEGTQAQWGVVAASSTSTWHDSTLTTVHCTDGDVTL